METHHMNNLVWKETTPDGVAESLVGTASAMDWYETWELIHHHNLGIHMQHHAMSIINDHVRSSRFEVGGLLLGRSYEWPALRECYPFSTVVTCAIPAKQTSESPVSLTMENSVWSEARRVAPELKVVGWYHSHPDLGAFFSGTDRRTQKNFFCLPHQIGLVIDPYRHEMACFAGPDSIEVTTCVSHSSCRNPYIL